MLFSSVNLLLHAVLTFSMTGIIWFVHLIHYPVLNSLKGQMGEKFEEIHWEKTMKPAIIMLTLELITGVILLIFRPIGVGILLPSVGLSLIILIWITTWGMCVPSHCELKKKYSEKSLRNLMYANISRAFLWSLRSALVITILFLVMMK